MTGGDVSLAVIFLSVGAPASLSDAIASVAKQGGPVELVVVNSGGGDARRRVPPGVTTSVLNFYPVLWPGAARNRGILASKAPFIAFLASDCLATEGWVAERLSRHRAGVSSVSSRIAAPEREGVVALCAHILNYGGRDPRTSLSSLGNAHGASYARWMFEDYGLFREDLRVGEDTEFNVRLDQPDSPVPSPEVSTIHRNPRTVLGLLADQWQRGARQGRYWPSRPASPGKSPGRQRFSRSIERFSAWHDGRKSAALFAWLALAAAVSTYEVSFRIHRQFGARTDVNLVRAINSAERRRSDKAILYLNRVSAAESKNPATAMLLASQARKAGDSPRAQVLADAVLQEDTLKSWARVERLKILLGPSARTDSEPARVTDVALSRHPSLLRQMIRLETQADAARWIEVLEKANACWPDIPWIGRLFVRAKIGTGDFETALTELRAQVERSHSFQAARDLLELLNARESAASVWEFVERCSTWLEPGLVLRLALRAVLLTNAREKLGPLLVSNQDVLSSDGPALVDATNVLLVLGRPDEASTLISQSSAPARAKLLSELNVALGRGQFAEGWQAYVLAGKPARQVPQSLLPALVTATYRAEGSDAAHTLLTGSLPSRTSMTVLHLLERVRIDGLDQLLADQPRFPEDRAARVLGLGRLLDSGVVTGANQAPLMQRFLKRYVYDPSFVPDCGTSFEDACIAAEAVLGAMRTRQAFSLVRLGDGEGNALRNWRFGAEQSADDLGASMRAWWDDNGARNHPKWPDTQLAFEQAVQNADMLGLPDLSRLVRTNRDQSVIDPMARHIRGLCSAVDYALDLPAEGRILTSCHLHQAFSYWEMWTVIIRQARRVSLVTCHPELEAKIVARFGVAVDKVHLIPGESRHVAKFTSRQDLAHFPEVYDRVADDLKATPPGHVVLIGAGFLGKIYCDLVKSAGGIGLDIGSAADYWCGYRTRTTVENAAFVPPDGLLERLETLAGSDARIGRLLGHR